MSKKSKSIVAMMLVALFLQMMACSAVGEEYTFYGTLGGLYYHTKENCMGMKNPLAYTLQAAINEGKAPCPKCCQYADMMVYGEKGNPYFHLFSDCSGMKHASSGTMVQAILYGLKICPICWVDF